MERHLKELRFLKESHAEYEKPILATLSQELAAKYGKGLKYSTLKRAVRFVEAFLHQLNCLDSVETIKLVPRLV